MNNVDTSCGGVRTNKSFALFKRLECVNVNGDIDRLCLDKMQYHILECLDALSHIKMSIEVNREPNVLAILAINNNECERLESAKDEVFASAISVILDGKSPYKRQREIIQVFPYESRLNDNVGWLPLHWATACGNKVTEENIKMIYAADPMALVTRHLKGYEASLGFTPISFLLMSKIPNMSLLLYFLKVHPKAFSISVGGIIGGSDVSNLFQDFYPLHIAAEYSESLKVLQILLQVATEVASILTNDSAWHGFYPLGLLCKREEFPEFWDMLSCLLEVDSSPRVIENAIFCVIKAKGDNTLKLIEMLLKANPEAAECMYISLLNEICEHLKGNLCLKVLSLFIAINEDAIIEAEEDDCGLLSVHTAARYNTVEVIEFLLNEYPGSETILKYNDKNLLHFALEDDENEINIVDAKVKFLTTKYPSLLQMYDDGGLTPFLDYLSCGPKIKIISTLIAADDQVVIQRGRENSGNDNELNNLLDLPLHMLLKSPYATASELPLISPVSEWADILRILIGLYPGAVSVKNIFEKYPYDYAVEKKFSPYFIRILLRGDPSINSTLLYDLNYAERRLAMFLAFGAVSRNIEITIWASLRFENKDLLKKVISFL